MFKRILVPVDLTLKSMPAVDLARNLSSQDEAEVILLHVIETIEHVEFAELKPFYDRLEASARKGLDDISTKFGPGNAPVDKAIVYGHRTKEIVKFANENRVDLIVMASHRIDPERPGHDWSSISYAVAVLAACPVLLVK